WARLSSRALASSRWSRWVDSTRVMPRARARRSPARIPPARASISISAMVTCLFKLDDGLVYHQAGTHFRSDGLDHPVLNGAQTVFHFHGLDHRQFLARLYFLAHFHPQRRQQAGHGGEQELGQIRRFLLDHVVVEFSGLWGYHQYLELTAAAVDLVAHPLAVDLHTHGLAVDGGAEQGLGALPVGDHVVGLAVHGE